MCVCAIVLPANVNRDVRSHRTLNAWSGIVECSAGFRPLRIAHRPLCLWARSTQAWPECHRCPCRTKALLKQIKPTIELYMYILIYSKNTI